MKVLWHLTNSLPLEGKVVQHAEPDEVCNKSVCGWLIIANNIKLPGNIAREFLISDENQISGLSRP